MKLIAKGFASCATLCAVAAPQSPFAAISPSQQCDYAAATAAESSGVPVDILLAISRVETGRGKDGEPQPWPWTINADGAGAWYDNKEEAVDAATGHLQDGTGTFDVGCFQLNIKWHGAAFASLDDMFDPQMNADYAASFLMQLYQENGDWGAAVAAYHSRTSHLAEAYLNKVKAVLNGGDLSVPSAPDLEPLPRENHFPLLQAGEQGSNGSIVPNVTARSPLIGSNS